jgi:outer membrane protein TolC
MNRFSLLAAALALALVAGCASVVTPGSHVPAAVSPMPAAVDAGIALGTPARSWWRALGDPMLDALVAQASERNHEVQAAVAAVNSARALANAAARDALPQGGLQAQAQALRPSTAEADPYRQDLPRPPSSRVATIGQGLAWEIDLFGRVGTSAAMADRRADATAADLHAATALLQAEVVRHYTGLRLRQHTLQVLAAEAAAHGNRAQQLRVRAEAGLADPREALAAEAEQVRVQAERAQAEAAQQTHLAALAVLAGRPPTERNAWSAALLVPAALPAVPADDAIVQPTDLLARRPDVARADAQLRAAIGETVLAERAHLPRVSLNLALGLNAPFGHLGDAGALRYAAGPALSWDWLDAGRLKARAAAARLGQEAAMHSFEQTVLRALQDSEVALRQWTAARGALADARRAETLAAQAAAHAHARVDAGLEPPQALLEAAATHQRARCSALSAQADALIAFGQAQLALGAWLPEDPNLAAVR